MARVMGAKALASLVSNAEAPAVVTELLSAIPAHANSISNSSTSTDAAGGADAAADGSGVVSTDASNPATVESGTIRLISHNAAHGTLLQVHNKYTGTGRSTS